MTRRGESALRGARTLGRPLPAHGGDQVEQYLLDYATQLMPHRTTWPVRAPSVFAHPADDATAVATHSQAA